jgi:transposase InsO family protein
MHRKRIDGMATVPVYFNKSLSDLDNKSTTDHPLLNVEDGASLSELSPKALSAALDRFSQIHPALNNPDHRLSTTQKKWLAAYKMEAASSGSGIFGLAPDFSSRGNSNRRISEEVIEILDAVVEEAAMRPNDSNHAPDLGLLRKRCKEAGLTPPSKQTFYQELAKRKAELDSITAKGGASAGYQNAPAKPVPASSHSRSSPMPWIVAMIDHTPLPIRLVQSQTRAPIDKTPWLTKMVDDSSGAVLGFFITWDRPNSDHLLAVLWDCCRRFKRLPETIALDGERPHDSISVEKVLAKSGIDKVSRRYKSPRDGSAVERSFKTMQDAVLSHLDGNYAERPNPLAWPEGWRPTNDATLTMGALWLALEKFYFETHNQEIRQQSIGNLTPYEYMIAMEQGYGAREHLSYQDLDRSSALILPFVRRKGSRTLRRESGVRIHGHSYLPAEQVTGFSYGKEYAVKYDPLDIRYALVYINGNWTRFVHRHVERFKGMDPLELAAISVELIQASKQHNSESDERAEKNADALEKIFTASPDPLAAWLEKQSTSTDSPAVANPWRESVTEVPRFDSFLEG